METVELPVYVGEPLKMTSFHYFRNLVPLVWSVKYKYFARHQNNWWSRLQGDNTIVGTEFLCNNGRVQSAESFAANFKTIGW